MLSGQPIIILKDSVERTRGQEAQRSNIAAAKAIAAAVRTTLGPRGMDKMLVSSTGDVVITNDGATILHEMAVQHPGAKMVIEVAETQDDEVGDGTTTACILVGTLMEQAEQLLAKMVHPTVIANGYTMGMNRALEIVEENSIRVDPADRETLIRLADTSMTGKSIEQVKEKLNGIVWGVPMIVLILGTGLYLQIRLRWLPLRKIGYGFRMIAKSRKADDMAEGEITPFAALMTALSATI
ncbi:MAG TPA: TCP-1/cpn60 chaperonin family protein, partial [Methanoregulaceae archaeon]|nr:TCP-1/cpn60 chaperonin family protein [Methanoregulaceae archaeon]